MRLSDLNPSGGRWPQPSSADAIKAVERGLRTKLSAALPDDLRPWLQNDVEHVLGLRSRRPLSPHASNIRLTSILSAAVGEEVQKLHDEVDARDMHFLTFTPASWATSLDAPQIDLRRMHQEAEDLLARVNFTGLAIFEPAPFASHPCADDGPLLDWHLHAVGYPSRPYEYERLLDELENDFGHTNLVGSYVLDKIVEQPRYVGSYCLKNSKSAKKAIPSVARLGKYNLRNNEIPNWMALRVGATLSYLRHADLIISQGIYADEIRERLLSKIYKLTENDRSKPCDNFELDRLWSTVWKKLERDCERPQIN